MARDKITEYSSTASENTVVGDVNIAENSALPSDMNNAVREVLSHLKEGLGSGTPLYVDQTNNRVGINKTPTVALDVSGDANLSGTLDVTGTVTAGGLTVDGTGNVVADFNTTNSNADITLDNTSYGVRLRTNNAGGFSVMPADTTYFNVAVNGDISFYEDTGTTPKLFWDSSEEALGLGTSSPTYQLDVTSSGSSSYAMWHNSTTGSGASNGFLVGASGNDATIWNYENATMQFATNNTERMRIKADGTLLYGDPTGTPPGSFCDFVFTDNVAKAVMTIKHDGATATNQYGVFMHLSNDPNDTTRYFMLFRGGATERARIQSNGDMANVNNSYGAISDIKLKEQITDASSQWDDIKALRVRKYKLKQDVANGDSDEHWRLGVVAQEVEASGMGGLVSSTTDTSKDEEGRVIELDTTTKQVKYSVLYMKAVKALQEAMTRIETLEAKVTALENG